MTNLSRDSVLGRTDQGRASYRESIPRSFFSLYSARRRYRGLLVDENTQLVVEGFPRSGNTFAVFAFRYAQQNDVE